jgi:hypothetical protein
MKKIVFIVLFYFMFLNLVSAVNIGVSPASVEFKGVLRGGYAERTIVISADSNEPVYVEISSRGEISSWISFSENNFSVTKDKPDSLTIYVRPPEDTPNGNYSGFLNIATGGLGNGVEGHAVGIVRSSLDLSINVGITDVEVLDCAATSFSVDSVEKGDDVVFNFNVLNNGNVRIKPSVLIDIWDEEQISVVKRVEFSDIEVSPTVEKGFEVHVDSNDLDVSQYFADVSVVDCFSSSTLTFDILEEGALKANGLLLGIINKKTVEVGETVPIKIDFKNVGEKEVSAYFKGEVLSGNRVVQVLESEKLNVPINEIESFNLYFTPQKEGKYVISGRVFYAGKRTFESTSTLEAVSLGFNYNSLFIGFVYVILLFSIVFLFHKIRKEKRKISGDLRRIKG